MKIKARFAPLVLCCFSLIIPLHANALTFEKRVASSVDDAEQSASGTISFNSSDLELTRESTNQTVGILFRGITLPPDATITNAYLEFTVDETGSEGTSLLIQGESSNNATDFSRTANNISLRRRTNASVLWQPEPWTQRGAKKRTPNISSIIQETISLPNWAAGNKIAFIITGSGKRTAEAYDKSWSNAPLLHVEYTASSGGGDGGGGGGGGGTGTGGQCKDTSGYLDAQGYKCSDWVGYDCTTAAEDWGYTQAQEQSIISNCALSCKLCDSTGGGGGNTGTDTTRPVITLIGSASMSLSQGSAFTDPGATASDNVDGNITSRIVRTGSVNTSTAGTYTLRYDVRDAAGNSASTVTRTVTVTSTNGGGGGGGSDVVKIAFIGDTGYGSNFQSVLNLIKAEKAQLTVVAGDTSYSASGDDDWDSRVRNALGSADPALVVAGNHDYEDSNFGSVRTFGQNRLNNQSNVSCSGSYGEQMTCRFKNVYLVMSAIGSGGSRTSHEAFISSSLDRAPAGAWRICAWHKNQRDMQVGDKTDEVGWTAYETCREKGAIIATGHEHSYERTHLLSDMSDKTISSTSSTFTVSPGNTFAFVSGLGGVGIRDQERSGNWWAKIYTSSQGATYGAMFGTFYPDRAEFYFKNIKGQIIDQFTVRKGY